MTLSIQELENRLWATADQLRANSELTSAEGQVRGDQSRAPLVALTEDLEQQFRTGLGEGYEAQFIDDQEFQAGQPLLQLHSVSS